MKFQVDVKIMPNPKILDPQGKAVQNLLNQLNINGVETVRVGKNVSFTIEAENYDSAGETVGQACQKLLCNPITEVWEFSLKEV